MPRWIVPGRDASAEPKEHLQPGIFDDAVRVEQIQSVEIDVTREGGETVAMSSVEPDEILELELEDGLKQWMRADQFEADFGQQIRRDRASNDLLIPTQLAFGPLSRGGGWVVKAVRRLNVALGKDLLGEIDAPGLAASALSGRLEKKAMPNPGFYRWDASARLVEVEDSDIRTDRTILVFIHGTFSSTKGGFGDLAADRDLWQDLQERYEGEIYTLNHHTLVESPLDNALALMRRLPGDAKLHLVSHSRGGVIGDLICRGQRKGGDPFDEDDLRVIQGDFDDEDDLANREGQFQSLADLNQLLRAKRPLVERFVRVAGPGSGSTLVSGRLDRWLSMLVNAMKLIPAIRASVAYDLVSAFTLAVVKERLNPRRFPGIEGMAPDSPLMKVVNRPDLETEADLTVISGDFEGSGVWGTLKDWATQLYYRDDNDLVVSAKSTFGGMRRATGGLYFFDRGSGVDHFHYFKNEKSVRKLVDGLGRKAADDAGFLKLADKRREIEERGEKMRGVLARQRDAGDRPVVFVLPGIMGSHLAAEGRRIWANVGGLARGGLGRLEIEETGIQADGLMASAYADIVEHLSATHKVVAFPYDWRRSLLLEAKRLADAVRAELGAHEQPVRILAHSMGGLLARTMIGVRKDVWTDLTARKGGRLVMLGTPTGGSFAIARVLLGKARLLRLLALVDFRQNKRRILEIVSRFIGLLELLPRGEAEDYFDPEVWNELEKVHGRGWVKPREADLETARRVGEHLDSNSLDPEHMIYVAGQSGATPAGLEIDKGGNGKGVIRVLATSQGDGSVTWSSGIPPHVPTWYMDAEHGKLAAHEPAFAALEELLTTGTTSRLSTSPPAGRGAEERFELPDDEVVLYPDEPALEAAALGFSSVEREKVVSDPVRIYVSHDHLAFAKSPVVVGHHEDDKIVGAEAALDHLLLGGRLSKRRDLGLYPGPVGTSEVILIRDEDPDKDGKAGAIIIGLGRIGELLPSHLETSFARGALQYALQVAEQSAAPPLTPRSISLTSLLIGTGFGGLNTGDSLRAILRAVVRSNESLAEAGAWVRLQEIQFLEIYSDRAMQAALILKDIVQEPRFRQHVALEPHVKTGSAGRERVLVGETSDWWHRLRIAKRSETDQSLSFTVLTERARAEINLLPDQRDHVERFVRRAVSSTRWNDLLANTLFHLLIPNELKHFASDRRNLVLVLDEDAAAYPWELLHDRSSGDTRPLATNSGLVRQLESDTFRRDVKEGVTGTALVVGDPPSDLVELPGAQLEAREVTERLSRGGYTVNDQIRTSPESIDTALFAEDYQVIHLAGHGVYEEESSDSGSKSAATGMVIGENLVLTPAQINQMPRIPELVFLNCCHLGRQDVESRIRDDYHLLAANLSTQFIRMGVRAVVAAGWAVDDAAARTFALEFYDQMLRGREFGDAVREARSATHEKHKNVNTWGAYQCYGDPSYRLRQRGGSGSSQREADFVSPDHATILISDIAQRAHVQKERGGSSQYIDWLKGNLERFRNKVPQSWWTESAKLSEAAGDACSELRMFGEAVEHYDLAARAEEATVSMRAIEQAANLRARHAVDLMARDDVKSADLVAMVEKSISDLKHLLEISPTAERYSLLGSAYKRLMTVRGRVTKKNLAGMADAYHEAYEKRKKAYPLVNWLTAGLASGPPSDLDELIDATIAGLKEDREDREDFWNRVTELDCEVIRHLYKGDLSKNRKRLAAEYGKVFGTGSPREVDSVLRQFTFQAQILKIAKKPEKEQEALALLEKELTPSA